METKMINVCPIHQIPLQNGECILCKKEKGKSAAKVIVAKSGLSKEKEVEKTAVGITCPNCGNLIPEGAHFCVFCGTEVLESRDAEASQELVSEFSIHFVPLEEEGDVLTCPLQPLAKPVAYYGSQNNLELLYYPQNDTLLIQNPQNSPWYILVNSPTQVFHEQEIRLGEIGFLLKYAGPGLSDLAKTQLIGQQKQKSKRRMIIDCLECIHPNFKGITINIEQNILEINRTYLTRVFSLSDEKYLKAAGVSSQPIQLKKLNHWWYLFPENAPNIFLKVPPFFIPVIPEKTRLFNNERFFKLTME